MSEKKAVQKIEKPVKEPSAVDNGLAATVRKLRAEFDHVVKHLKETGILHAGFKDGRVRIGVLASIGAICLIAIVAFAETVTFPIFDQTTYGNGKFTANSATAKTTLTVDYIQGAVMTNCTISAPAAWSGYTWTNVTSKVGTYTGGTITGATGNVLVLSMPAITGGTAAGTTNTGGTYTSATIATPTITGGSMANTTNSGIVNLTLVSAGAPTNTPRAAGDVVFAKDVLTGTTNCMFRSTGVMSNTWVQVVP